MLSVEIMGSFFRNQTFPKNWHRRANAAGFDLVTDYGNVIQGVHPEVLPGANNAQGVYVLDNLTDVGVLDFTPPPPLRPCQH